MAYPLGTPGGTPGGTPSAPIRPGQSKGEFLRKRTGRGNRDRDEVRQLVHGPGQIVQPTMRVTSGQDRRTMPGEFLSSSRIHPMTAQHRQIRVPERMEVGKLRPVRPFNDVRDARGFEVHSEHIGGFHTPAPPDGSVSGFGRRRCPEETQSHNLSTAPLKAQWSIERVPQNCLSLGARRHNRRDNPSAGGGVVHQPHR